MARRNPKDLLGYILAVTVGYFATKLVPDPSVAAYVYILVSYHAFLAWVVLLSDDDSGLSMPIGTTILTHLACVFLAVGATMARHYLPFFALLRFGIIAIAGFERKWLFTVSRHAPKADPTLEVDLLKPLQAAPLAKVSSTIDQPPARIAAYTPSPRPSKSVTKPAAAAAPAPAAAHGAGIPKYQPLVELSQPAATAEQAPPKPGPARAKDLRRQPTKEEAGVSPILSATAQDHEEWLRQRARLNPTHRRPGASVRDEYEEWLKERFRIRAAEARKANAGAH